MTNVFFFFLFLQFLRYYFHFHYLPSDVCITVVKKIKGEMYEEKYYPPGKNLTYFLEKFTYTFLPLEIKVSFLNQKMYIFQTCFGKRNFRSHFLCILLKALANKICKVMWGWKIYTWRTEHNNHLPSWVTTCDAFGSTYFCENIPGLRFS